MKIEGSRLKKTKMCLVMMATRLICMSYQLLPHTIHILIIRKVGRASPFLSFSPRKKETGGVGEEGNGL